MKLTGAPEPNVGSLKADFSVAIFAGEAGVGFVAGLGNLKGDVTVIGGAVGFGETD